FRTARAGPSPTATAGCRTRAGRSTATSSSSFPISRSSPPSPGATRRRCPSRSSASRRTRTSSSATATQAWRAWSSACIRRRPMIVGSASDAGTDRGVHQYNTPEAPGHGMHAEMRRSLAFSQDGDWLFAPDMHDRGVRILNLASGKAYPVYTGDAPFYKAMSVSVPSSLVALLHPGDVQGRGPYGLEVWRLTYSTR